MRVFRREDVVQVRVAARPGEAPLRLDVVHVDLYFFYDVDVVMLNVEVRADGLTLAQTQELLYRFGRGYPPGWDARGARIVWTWCFRLAPQADGSTRVNLRVRGRMAPWWFAALYLAIIGPADLVMATGMLRGLQARCRVSSTGPIRLPSANRGPCQAAETVDR